MRKVFAWGMTVLFIAIFSLDSYAVEWQKEAGGWKLLDNKGNVCTEQWFYDSGKQYYLDDDGYMSVGWTLIGDDWYYFEDDGTLVTDQWIDERYVDYSGKMLKDADTKDGHHVGADGHRTDGASGGNDTSSGASDGANAESSGSAATASRSTGNSSTEHYVPSKPIEIKYMRAHMTKDGWISPNIYFFNSSGKIINQISFTVTPYDTAHNEVSCEVTGISTIEKTVNGPFYPDNPEVCGKYIMAQDGTIHSADPATVTDYAMTFDNSLVLDHIWFNKNISTYAIVGIKLMYQDGSIEIVDPYSVIKQSY